MRLHGLKRALPTIRAYNYQSKRFGLTNVMLERLWDRNFYQPPEEVRRFCWHWELLPNPFGV